MVRNEEPYLRRYDERLIPPRMFQYIKKQLTQAGEGAELGSIVSGKYVHLKFEKGKVCCYCENTVKIFKVKVTLTQPAISLKHEIDKVKSSLTTDTLSCFIDRPAPPEPEKVKTLADSLDSVVETISWCAAIGLAIGSGSDLSDSARSLIIRSCVRSKLEDKDQIERKPDKTPPIPGPGPTVRSPRDIVGFMIQDTMKCVRRMARKEGIGVFVFHYILLILAVWMAGEIERPERKPIKRHHKIIVGCILFLITFTVGYVMMCRRK